MLSGHTHPDDGRIIFKDQDISRSSPHRVARKGIVRKFQRPSFYSELTVRENLTIAVLGTARSRRSRTSRVDEVADLVRLGDACNSVANSLSHGETQWLEIGLLLARDAELLLLDEPTAGMSPEETQATARLIRRLVDGLETSAVVIEHDMGFVRALDSPITVLHLGEVIAEGSMTEIEANDQVRRVYLGEDA